MSLLVNALFYFFAVSGVVANVMTAYFWLRIKKVRRIYQEIDVANDHIAIQSKKILIILHNLERRQEEVLEKEKKGP